MTSHDLQTVSRPSKALVNWEQRSGTPREVPVSVLLLAIGTSQLGFILKLITNCLLCGVMAFHFIMGTEVLTSLALLGAVDLFALVIMTSHLLHMSDVYEHGRASRARVLSVEQTQGSHKRVYLNHELEFMSEHGDLLRTQLETTSTGYKVGQELDAITYNGSLVLIKQLHGLRIAHNGEVSFDHAQTAFMGALMLWSVVMSAAAWVMLAFAIVFM